MTVSSDFARVVAIIDNDGLPVTDMERVQKLDEAGILEVVISAGSENGVTDDMRFVLYESGEELRDPVNGSSLGQFEIVKGRGRITHLQPRMSILRSTQTRRVLLDPFSVSFVKSSGQASEPRTVAVPFKSIKIGDLVRPI
ncbi:MAG: hypothetical protein EON58_14120 [Alphaproteobacteria bacterium]|nr:MAG: hypothetical protein EON58_14120 [Alphaproteobacteria bacterium]